MFARALRTACQRLLELHRIRHLVVCEPLYTSLGPSIWQTRRSAGCLAPSTLLPTLFLIRRHRKVSVLTRGIHTSLGEARVIRPSPSVLTDDDDDGSDIKTPCSDRTTSRESLVHGVLTSLLASVWMKAVSFKPRPVILWCYTVTSDSGGGDTAKRRISDGLSVLSEGLRYSKCG
jgi:hypothetical protein